MITQLAHCYFLQVRKIESLLIFLDYAASLEITSYYYLKLFITPKYTMSIIKMFHLIYKDEKSMAAFCCSKQNSLILHHKRLGESRLSCPVASDHRDKVKTNSVNNTVFPNSDNGHDDALFSSGNTKGKASGWESTNMQKQNFPTWAWKASNPL